MNKLVGFLTITAALASTTAVAGVTFYEAENFSGTPFNADGSVPNFVARGFNDRARSAVVDTSPVEVCRDINFSGGCAVLNPGRYATLGEWSGKISSVRPVSAPPTVNTPQAGRVTFSEAENFAGSPFTADGAVPNFVTRGFNDRARSAVVDGAPVEVCRDVNFGGGCTVFNPGRYPTLGEWSAKISSVRPVAAPRTETAPPMGRVTLYEAEDFEGRAFSVNGAVPNFQARGFNDRAESAVVEGAPVEICADVNFGGRCTVLKPGRYATLGEFRNRVSSVRPVAPVAQQRDGMPGGGRWASATLYGGPNLTGRAVTLDREGASDLQGFNGRASSLVVERGYWIFCTEPDYRGECRTFGPGEYRQLPADFDNSISSGRRISNNYPYANRPNWEGNR